jgi:signal transduction histidine kinase
VDGTVQTVRKVSEDLRPGLLDDFGLSAAIEWQAEEFQKRTGIECKTAFNQDEFDISREQSTNLFRIVQEALTNVIRHAEASNVEIRFNQGQDVLLLEIQDNGIGIEAESIADAKSFGLIGIKERARSLGGEVTITGSRHQGTCLTVKMPISERKNCHD